MALPKRLRCSPDERQILSEQIKDRAKLDEASRAGYPAPTAADDSLEGALRWVLMNLFHDRPAFALFGLFCLLFSAADALNLIK